MKILNFLNLVKLFKACIYITFNAIRTSIFQCQTDVYMKEDGEFKKLVLVVGPVPCCNVYNYSILRHIIETYNVPKACPFVPVSIHTYILFFSPGATTPIGCCILQPSSGL